ncbi:MAG TPA: hypothetical protein VHS56_03130 [Candidatus Cybelea sp.]|jgi:hypothetical protein|nr:hypothetical protein [Candidatus Cybelea sp.]
MNDDATTKIAALLTKVGDVHHMVFADTDGSDDDWATFYSDWLLNHSELSKLLGKRPVRSHLTRDLVNLDEEYSKQNPSDPWPQWYAQRLLIDGPLR